MNRPLIRPARHLSQPPVHAPNAALLIDFDNVTLGIQKDLTKELRTLLSSEIIKAHGGEIGVSENPGGGSIFWFRIPKARALA